MKYAAYHLSDIFTYHIVNIKRTQYASHPAIIFIFTYHIVNIKH